MALVVFTGGARSGKSAAAERLAEQRSLDGQRVVVAVFGRCDDPEMTERIERHRAARPAAFETVEVGAEDAWLDAVKADSLLVVDCLGTLLGRCMERAGESFGDQLADADSFHLPDGYEAAVAAIFDPLVDSLASRAGDTIVVTNEVGDGVVPAYASGRLFRDLLGRANRTLVSAADASHLCVAGRLVDLNRLPKVATWPED